MRAEDKCFSARSFRSTDVQEIPSASSYPNWSASMQGYYSSGAALPPYFTSSAASSVPHPFLWHSQHPMVSPYGAPLPQPSIYPLGSLYAPGIPSISTTPHTASASTAVEGKASHGRDSVSLSVSQNNKAPGNAVMKGENTEESEKVAPFSEHDGASQSDGGAFPSSSETSSDNGSQEESSTTKRRDFNQSRDCEASTRSTQDNGENFSSSVPKNLSLGMTHLNIEKSYAYGAPRELASTAMDPREIKLEKRKQSNRESARRSRLRKMAECEELQVRVDLLSTETRAMREELQRLAEECEKVTSENNTIMEELTHLGGYNVTPSVIVDDHVAAVCSVKDKENSHRHYT